MISVAALHSNSAPELGVELPGGPGLHLLYPHCLDIRFKEVPKHPGLPRISQILLGITCLQELLGRL